MNYLCMIYQVVLISIYLNLIEILWNEIYILSKSLTSTHIEDHDLLNQIISLFKSPQR
jgi:hypothetical protein